jgi:hypothetical protein
MVVRESRTRGGCPCETHILSNDPVRAPGFGQFGMKAVSLIFLHPVLECGKLNGESPRQ